MPIYEYQCQKCGTFEFTQRITDKPLGKCPTCKGKVKKLISNTSFQLKGTGWYITDYARKDKGGSEKSASPGENGKKPATEGKGEASKDSKAAASSSGSEKSSTSSTPAQ
jgi:putative FmdB family regulatory protein